MANVSPFIAPPARRIAGGMIDLVLAVMPAVFILGVVYEAGYKTDEARVALVMYALYHAAFFQLWDGQTPGMRTFDIRAVSRTGGIGLSLVQTVARASFRPALVYGLAWTTSALTFPANIGAVMVAATLLAELGMMVTLPTRQTLSDLVSRTLVVNVPPPQPHRAPAAPMYSPTDAEFGLRPGRRRR